MSDPSIPDKVLERIGIDAGRNLFVPAHFDLSETSGILGFIEQNPLAQFVSAHEGNIRITAATLIHDRALDPGSSRYQQQFIGHIARRNPQAEAIRQGAECVALTCGPDAYISPRWNMENPSLPTWSYISVQLRGDFDVIDDQDGTYEVLARTIERMEREAEQPWSLEDAPADLVDLLIPHIIAFRFRVSDMQGIMRLNQNKKAADKERIIRGLLERGDCGSKRIAALMAAAIDEQKAD